MIEYKYADLFGLNSEDKQITITSDDGLINITNADIHQEEFELDESLCSESELTFGCCEAGMIKFKASNVFLPMKGKWLTTKLAVGGYAEEPLLIGRHKVYSDTPTADRKWREVVAYDALYDVVNEDMAAWYNSLKFPMTLKAFRNEVFRYFGYRIAFLILFSYQLDRFLIRSFQASL